ncbi:MAG TPA: hypothetical protein VL307_07875 [Chitinophagaceae bacterium]|nr:hypothetical protein [Chitinophagaceae bacterium]
MTDKQYITGSCSILGNEVIKNGSTVFRQQEASVQTFLASVYGYTGANYPRFYKMDNLCKLGWLATEILLAQTFDAKAYAPEEIGLVFSNRSSSLDTDIKYYDTVKTMASPALFVYTLPNIVMGEICIRHQFKGENDFFIFDDFNAVFIHDYVTHLFNSGALKACICGWVELLDDAYRACLYLVEARQNNSALPFTIENINQIYQKTHG